MCRQLAGHLNCLLCSGFWIPSAVVERVIHYVWHDWRICGGIKWDYGLELFHPLPAHTRASPLPITHPFPLPAFFAGLVIDLLAFSPLSLCPPSRVYLYVCVCVWLSGCFGWKIHLNLLYAYYFYLRTSTPHIVLKVLLAAEANANAAYSCIIKQRQDRCKWKKVLVKKKIGRKSFRHDTVFVLRH